MTFVKIKFKKVVFNQVSCFPQCNYLWAREHTTLTILMYMEPTLYLLMCIYNKLLSSKVFVVQHSSFERNMISQQIPGTVLIYLER